MHLIIREHNNKTIRQRNDGYFSATDMCKACGKLFGHWFALKATTEYLQALKESIGIAIDQLVEVNESSGTNDQRGTWVHRRVAIRLAQWLSPEFAVQVDAWVEEMLLNQHLQPKQPKLAQEVTDNTIAIHLQAITTFQDNGDLQLAALLKTRFGNLLLAEQQNLLPGQGVQCQLEGAVDVAIRLKIKLPRNYEGALGKYVKTKCAHLAEGLNQRYSTASGKIIPATMYPSFHPEVEKAVLEFAALKALPFSNQV